MYARTSSVITSSCVGPSTLSRPWRSLKRTRFSPYVTSRPVCCHSSAGCIAGSNTSAPPIRFISSRTMLVALCRLRKPRGRKSYAPAVNWRISPARSMSWWLTIWASAGVSFWVGMSVWLQRIEGFPCRVSETKSRRGNKLAAGLGSSNGCPLPGRRMTRSRAGLWLARRSDVLYMGWVSPPEPRVPVGSLGAPPFSTCVFEPRAGAVPPGPGGESLAGPHLSHARTGAVSLSNAKQPTRHRPIIERLESRQLLAGDASIVRPLPFVLEFGTDHASTSLHDKDGQGTGFTYVQPNRLGNEYDPSLIDLRTNEGVLRLTTAGNVANQGNYGKDNTQINALQTQFDASGDGAFTITTRLKGPLRPIAQPYEQAGIIFGPNQDNWVKLVMIATTDSVGIQFIDEQKVGTRLIRSLAATAYSPLPALHAVQTLDLIMSATPINNQMSAYYRVNAGPLIRVPGVLQLSDAKAASFFSSTARAGVYTAQANDLPPEIMVFDRFVIEPGKIQITRPDITATRPAHRATGVDRMTFVAADVFLPTPGSGIDESTISSSTVKLYRTSDGQAVDVVRNT